MWFPCVLNSTMGLEGFFMHLALVTLSTNQKQTVKIQNDEAKHPHVIEKIMLLSDRLF